MAAVTISPTISLDSQTLSAQSIPPGNQISLSMDNSHPQSLLISALTASPYTFLQPSSSLHAAALLLTKEYLDPLAAGVSTVQAERWKDHRRADRKRKRRPEETGERENEILRLKQVHVEGFGVQQVWEQARRVVDAVRMEVERSVDSLSGHGDTSHTKKKVLENQSNGESAARRNDNQSTSDTSEGDEQIEESIGEPEEINHKRGKKVHWDADDGDASDAEEGPDQDDDGNDEMEMEVSHNDVNGNARDEDVFVPDRNGLNDGFFSIDDFNKRAEFLERQDATGGPDNEAASDEEEIDWDADPLAMNGSLGTQAAAGDTDQSEEEDDGPTFDNADVQAPFDSDSDGQDGGVLEEGEMEDLGQLGNTNNIMYADFFAPPAKKAGKKKRGRPNPHNFPATKDGAAIPRPDMEDDVQRTISAVHRDLFEDDASASESADELDRLDPSDPKSRRSTHELRQAKIAEEIRQLEAANVAKREWTLSGEARAVDRPLNSLLEEDLEFERAGKPVPVITAEVSEDIEAMIKRRILAREFDEVIRRRPDDLVTGGSQLPRRGRLEELDDTKDQKSLADIYADDHLRRTDPNYVDQRDERLKKAHSEIEALWRDVSSRLDALASWHYRPKPATASLEVRVDAPTITMEDARPALGPEVGGASRLAPQEVYKVGEAKSKNEVVTKAGAVLARDEMTREEKLRRRRREKERIRKAGHNATTKNGVSSGKAQEKKKVADQLKKGGVRVIGRKGDVVDVEGKAVKQRTGTVTGGSFKL